MLKLTKQKDLEKGDIISVEYGNYDNWVKVVVDKVEDDARVSYGCKLTCHYLDSKQQVVMYGDSNSTVEVLGKEK